MSEGSSLLYGLQQLVAEKSKRQSVDNRNAVISFSSFPCFFITLTLNMTLTLTLTLTDKGD